MTETELFKIDRKEIRKMIPNGYGYCKKIAKLAGVSGQCLCHFWKGESDNPFVKRAILDVIKEIELLEIEIDKKAKGITDLINNRKSK